MPCSPSDKTKFIFKTSWNNAFHPAGFVTLPRPKSIVGPAPLIILCLGDILKRRGGLQEFWQLKLIKILTTVTACYSLGFLSKPHRKVKDEKHPTKLMGEKGKFFYPPMCNLMIKLVSLAAWPLQESDLELALPFSSAVRPPNSLFSLLICSWPSSRGAPFQGQLFHLICWGEEKLDDLLIYLSASFYKGVTHRAGFLPLLLGSVPH